MRIPHPHTPLPEPDEHRRRIDVHPLADPRQRPALPVELDSLVDLLGGQAASSHWHIVAMQDLAHGPSVDPELVAQWNGPHGTEMRINDFDCRTGGSYRYVHISDGNEFGFRGCFHEVRPAELIVQTFTFEGIPDGVALERLTFEDLGGGRTRLTSTSLVDSFADRDAFVASGMEQGVHDSYERLDDLLAR